MSKKDNKKDNNVLGKVALGAAVIGAGAIAAKVLSDEDNRKKIGDAMKDAGEKGKEFVENVKDRLSESIESLRAEYDQIVEQLEERIEDAKGEGKKALNEIQIKAKKLGKDFDNFKEDAGDKSAEAMADLKDRVGEIKGEFEEATKA